MPFRNSYLDRKKPDNNMTDEPVRDQELDITGGGLPDDFRAHAPGAGPDGAGQILLVRLRGEEPLRNVPRTAREQGHEVLSLETGADGVATLLLRRGG